VYVNVYEAGVDGQPFEIQDARAALSLDARADARDAPALREQRRALDCPAGQNEARAVKK
jgi:hypothetical protein